MSSSGASCLHYAASKGHKDIVAFLLEQAPALLGNQDKRGDSVLHKAVRHIAIVQLLLDKGANVKSRNKRGRTPLHDAAEEGDEAVSKLLLQAGADADVKDEEGATPRSLGGQALEGIWPKRSKQ